MWRACAGALLCVVGLAAEAAPGDWDHSFGVDGRVPLSVAVTGTPRVWKQQADGKIVTAGHGKDASGTTTAEYFIARFNPDGTPDTSLDGDGILRVDLGGQSPFGKDLEVLPDGRLLFAGQAGTDFEEVRLLRFNRDGSPDISFGTGGQLSLTEPPRWVQNPHIALTPNGAAYFVALRSDSTNSSLLVARVTADGVLDTSFGTGGRTVVEAPSSYLRPQIVRSDANGRLVMGGTLGPFDTGTPLVARLTNTGQLDSSFGDNGIVVMPFLQGHGWVNRLAIAADGKILAAGERFDANQIRQHFVARLNTNGTFDASFGSGGRIVAPGGIRSLLLEPDGKLLLGGTIGGTISELRPGLAWLARYNSDGSPDVTFGLRGRSRVDFSLSATFLSGEITHIQRDSDGSYRAVAQLTDTSSPIFTSHFTLARFAASGSNAGVIGLRSANSTEDYNRGILTIFERAASHGMTVYRSGGSDGTVSVQYRIVGQSATAGQDFVAATGTITFNDGETLKSFDLQVLDDGVREEMETLYVELFAPTGGASLSRSRLDVRMESDGDVGSHIAIVTPGARAIESAGTIRFLVQRSGDLSAPVAVDYTTVAGTASAGTDFTATSGTISWPANAGGVRAIDITIADDASAEADEQFSLELSSSDPVVVFTTYDPPAVITITDDDAARSPTVTFKSTQVVASEGASVVTFEAVRLGDPSQALTATWQTSETSGGSSSIARPGVDYIAASGTLTWTAGDSSPKTFTVTILEDTASEYAEYFSVSLSAAYPTATLDGSASASIADNDPAPTQPVISVSPEVSVAESAGNANLTVTLTGVPVDTVNVNYAVQLETATSADVSWTSGTLTWAVGDSTPKQISIPIIHDTLDEIDETFVINLSDAAGTAQFVTAQSRFTILDDDPTPAGQSPPTGPRLQVSAVSVREGDRVARLTVSRTGSTDALTVSCEVVSGTASEPADFIGGSYRLYWAAGNTDSKHCEIQLNGDAQVEPDETFTVRFSPSEPGLLAAPLATATATITIVDDDGPNSSPARIDFVDTALSVNESATSVTLQVGRSGNTSIASSIDYITVAGSAGSADHAATTGTLTWDINDNSIKLITVTLTPDAVDEPDESFTVQLRNVSSGTEIGAASASVSIVDDDTAPGTPDSGSSGGGGGQESLITLLLLAALVSVRLVFQRGRRMPPSF